MARAKRRSMKRRSFVAKDWVYTDDGYRDAVYSQNSGIATSFAFPLIYSVNSRRHVLYGARNVAPANVQYQGGYSEPDVAKTVIYKVDGHVVYNPSAWALGNEFKLGWRLVIGKMIEDTGLLLVPANYSLWQSSAAVHFANWRNNAKALAEGRMYKAFGDNTSNGAWRSEVRWSSSRGRALDHDEGLFLYLELPSVSVNTVRNNCFVRTLTKRPT